MIVYRFAHFKYADDISGRGAKLKGGRWNPRGIAVLYTSESISLALLEVLVNADTIEELQQLKLLEINISPSISWKEIKTSQLKEKWQFDFEYTQWLGKEILTSPETIIIKCPSAVIEQEYNYLINPNHSSFKKISIKTKSDFYFDKRLFKQIR